MSPDRIGTYKAQSPGKLAPFDSAQGALSEVKWAQHNKAPGSGDLPAYGRSGSRQRRPRMPRLCSSTSSGHGEPVEPCSDSSRPYPGRSVRLAVAPCGSALCGNMQGDRAEPSVARRLPYGSPKGGAKRHQLSRGHSRRRTPPLGGVATGNEPRWNSRGGLTAPKDRT